MRIGVSERRAMVKGKINQSTIKAIISMLITFIGALGIAVCIIMSETLFPEIEEFSACPEWYRGLMYASLAVVAIGLVFCAFAKNKSNTTEKEFEAEFAFMTIGAVCAGFAFSSKEAYWIDVLSTTGAGIACMGFILGIGSGIGLSKKPKGVYVTVLKKADVTAYKEAVRRGGAEFGAIMEAENRLETAFPMELVSLYREFDGDGDLIFSVDEAVRTNIIVRTLMGECCPVVEDLVFFGGNGCGDYFCYDTSRGYGAMNVIYLWKHETLDVVPVALSLEALIINYYAGRIS